MREQYLFGIVLHANYAGATAPHCRFCREDECGTYCFVCQNVGWWVVLRG